jgi:hypothetical protein
MEPDPTSSTPTVAELPPALVGFARAMRSVLRTRHDSPAGGPEAVETWTPAGGCVWQWSTPAGLWRVTAGEASDPRPLLHGPGGWWRVDYPADAYGADLVLVMLRAAGAIPSPTGGEVRPGPARAVVRGRAVVASPAHEPWRAVVYRASDPEPEVPFGYVTVRATGDEPDEQGRWAVTLPDGRAHTYDPAAPRYLVPYEDPTGEAHPLSGARRTMLLIFEPGQRPGVRAFMVVPDGGTLSWPTALTQNGLPAPGAATYTPPASDETRGAA